MFNRMRAGCWSKIAACFGFVRASLERNDSRIWRSSKKMALSGSARFQLAPERQELTAGEGRYVRLQALVRCLATRNEPWEDR